jgi:hypothetical protein
MRLQEPVVRISSNRVPVTHAEAETFGLKVGPWQRSGHRWAGLIQDIAVWLDVPLSDDWNAAYRLIGQSGRPVVAELRVYPAGGALRGHRLWEGDIPGVPAEAPKGGITARLLRRLKAGAAARTRDLIIAKLYELKNEKLNATLGIDRLEQRPLDKKRPVTGRPRHLSDRDYRQLAKRYVILVKGGCRNPRATLAKETGLTRACVNSRLTRARPYVLAALQDGEGC